MAKNLPGGKAPNLPGLQAQCTQSAYKELKRACLTDDPCTECEYWPIYPCYQSKRAMIDCVAEYTNDGISVDKETDTSSAVYMYEALMNEGHDGQLLRFSPSEDGTIPGGHQNPKNVYYWQVGCWGITSPCDEACEAQFLECVAENDGTSASSHADAFATCIGKQAEGKFGACSKDCAPTINMLMASEVPTDMKLNNFGGTAESTVREQPETSLCEA